MREFGSPGPPIRWHDKVMRRRGGILHVLACRVSGVGCRVSVPAMEVGPVGPTGLVAEDARKEEHIHPARSGDARCVARSCRGCRRAAGTYQSPNVDQQPSGRSPIKRDFTPGRRDVLASRRAKSSG